MIYDALIQKLVEKGQKLSSFSVQMPDGKVYKAGKDQNKFTIVFKTKNVFKELALKGDFGLGEQFMLGNIEINGDFDEMLRVIYGSLGDDIKPGLLVILFDKFKRTFLTNNKNRALKNVNAHYDLSNDFYKLFLDKSFTYSCAYFKSENDSLELAQRQKHEILAKKLMLKNGETLVDVGCGWGEMLIFAAKEYKVKGYGVTLSKEQFTLANKRILDEGLSDMVKIELKDYRDIEGIFDKFVSIGMFEHVGWQYYQQFFEKVKQILKPKSLGVLHTIGTMKYEYRTSAWFDKYIFPGGELPTLSVISKEMNDLGLEITDVENLRRHYAITLGRWIDGVNANYDKIVKMKGIEFARMWKLYLYICKALFLYGYNKLYQVTFTNGLNNELPMTREYLYE